jgi:hypothetical protein
MIPKWSWARASCTGTSHLRRGERRQDAVLCGTLGPDASIFFGIVCDGAGSASHGGHGARLCSRLFARSLCAFVDQKGALPDEEILLSWLDEARDLISRSSSTRQLPHKAFAATLVVAVSDARSTCCFQIGDGAAVLRNAQTQDWVVPNWPFHGEYASTTSFFTDHPQPTVAYHLYEHPIDALCIFSDGLEGLALDFRSRTAFAPFFNGMIQPISGQAETGMNHSLSESLATFLCSERVTSRTDDDKTLVLAAVK